MAKPFSLRLLGYLLYGLVLTAVLLYVRFPAEKAELYLTRLSQAAFPSFEFAAGAKKVTFPPALEMDRLLVSSRRDGRPLLLLENVHVAPTLAGVGREYRLAAQLHGGNVSGILKISPLARTFSFVDMAVRDVRCEDLQLLQETGERKLAGTVSLSGAYSGSWQAGESVALNGKLELKQGIIGLRQPILTIGELKVSSLAMELVLDGQELRVKDGTMQADSMAAGFTGTMQMAQLFKDWKLAIDGELEMRSQFLKDKPRVSRVVQRLQKQYDNTQIPYYIKGTMANPRFAFGKG